MRTHLSSKHPSLNISKSGHGDCLQGGPRQATLTSFAKTISPLPTAQQEKLTKQIALMCALDLKPLSMVQGIGFKMYSNALNPNFKVPTRPTVTKYLHALYEVEKQKLVQRLNGLPLSVTTDLWTSNALQGYITLTGHYVTADWSLNANVLATRRVYERHTGSNIASEVRKILEDFKVQSLTAIATDNAANMALAAKELDTFHVSCFAHTLQLAIEDGLKLPQIA